jgi:AcrR family transcriptional regulator
MTTEEPADTKQRILDAAERLFVEQGFDSASMRSITSKAGVNLAAVNYHFGNKESLVGAVMDRRIAPLNRERLERLDQLERGDRASAPELGDLVEAFVGPALRLSADPVAGETVMRLVGHAITLHGPMRRVFVGQFRAVFERYVAAIGRVLPEQPPEEVIWKFLFMIGSMAHTMCLSHDVSEITEGRVDTENTEAIIDRLVAFISAGLRARVSAAAEPS